jgi:hypothetical protein
MLLTCACAGEAGEAAPRSQGRPASVGREDGGATTQLVVLGLRHRTIGGLLFRPLGTDVLVQPPGASEIDSNALDAFDAALDSAQHACFAPSCERWPPERKVRVQILPGAMLN